MNIEGEQIRVMYSFPHKLGGARLCDTGLQEVISLCAAGAEVIVHPGVQKYSVPEGVVVRPTLARGKLRIPYRVLGKMRALALHDHIVARRLKKAAREVNVVHTFPVGSLETLRTARALGIPSVLERTNAHTRFAFETVRKEAERLGVILPPEDEYFFRDDLLEREEAEYEAADYILCPSEFVAKTFVARGFPREKLVQYFNGVDDKAFYPSTEPRLANSPFTMLFVGVCAVRKGVHFALEAWLKSPASRDGVFLIVGDFLPSYQAVLGSMLAHPSVKVLGHAKDVPALMRKSDILVLPSIEEGFGRVITEAMASGCVPLASEACTEICRHMETGLVHRIGDVGMLSQQISMLYENRTFLNSLRATALKKVHDFTWRMVGVRLLEVYRNVIQAKAASQPQPSSLVAL